MKAVDGWLQGVDRSPVEQQDDLAGIDNRSLEILGQRQTPGPTFGAITPLQEVSNNKSKDRVNDPRGTPQRAWRVQQAHSGDQRKPKRLADQALLPLKRANLGRGTWEDPVLIE